MAGRVSMRVQQVADKLDRNGSPSRPLELNCTFMSLGQMISNYLSKISTTVADKLDHWARRGTPLTISRLVSLSSSCTTLVSH